MDSNPTVLLLYSKMGAAHAVPVHSQTFEHSYSSPQFLYCVCIFFTALLQNYIAKVRCINNPMLPFLVKKIHKQALEYKTPIMNAMKELRLYYGYRIKNGLELGNDDKIKDQKEEGGKNIKQIN